MTEKRFNLVKCKEHRWGIEDNTLEKEDKLFFICGEGQFETNGLVLLLNQLNDNNEQLKKDATTLIYSNQDYRKENEHIKNTIKEAYETERTHIGKSVLKQLLNNIEAIQ